MTRLTQRMRHLEETLVAHQRRAVEAELAMVPLEEQPAYCRQALATLLDVAPEELPPAEDHETWRQICEEVARQQPRAR